MDKELTGFMRFQLVRIWFKNYRAEMDKEDYVKKACVSKGITYIEPPSRATRVSRSANMFPGR